MKFYSKSVLFASILVLSNLVYAVSMTTNYQGYLENSEAEPLNDTVDMSFVLYDEGGSSLWSEIHQGVTVINGVFSLILGSSTPFDDDSLDGERFLGITIGDDAEMNPRQRLTSSFFAMRAGVADAVATDSVDTESISDSAVTSEKIAVGSVTADKIADGVTITADERLKLKGLGDGGVDSNPTFNTVVVEDQLNVKKRIKVGENSLYLGQSQTGTDNSIYTDGGHLIIQDNDNNVGIGTDDPKAKLDVEGIIKATSKPLPSTFFSDFADGGIYMRYDNTVTDSGGEVGAFKGGDFTRLFLSGDPTLINATNGAGNVGIGQFVFGSGGSMTVREPEAKLHVYSSSNPNIKLQAPNGSSYQTFEMAVASCNGCFAPYAKNGDAVIRKLGSSHNLLLNMPNNNNDGNSYITFGDDHNQRTMSVFNNGRIGIGTTNPKSKLHVDGGLRAKKGDTNGDGSNVGYAFDGDGDTGMFAVGGEFVQNSDLHFKIDHQARLVVRDNGNVGIGTTTPSCKLDVRGGDICRNGSPIKIGFSDKRWKKDIKPLENSLEKVSKLEGINYKWNIESYPEMGFDDKLQVGLIAQEVEQVIPELVTTNTKGYKSIDYDKITAVLVEAVKELKTQNDALKTIVCQDHPEETICQ